MPTKNRLRFLPRAIRCYQAQTYPNRELLILDDGPEGARELIPDDPTITYARCHGVSSLGAKRNLACEMARGEYIAHWDDDDWSHPDRLRTMHVGISAELAGTGAVCGFRQCLFWNESSRSAHLYDGALNFVLGTSLFYRRDWWQRNKFQDRDIAEDYYFVKAARRVLRVEDGLGMMVATTHSNGTSPRSMCKKWKPVERTAIPEDYWIL